MDNYDEIFSIHHNSVYEEELTTRLLIGNIDSLINYYHILAYAESVQGSMPVSEDHWCELCDAITENIEKASKFHQKTVDLNDLLLYTCNYTKPVDGKFVPGKTFHPSADAIFEDLNKSLDISGEYIESQ